MASHRPVRVLFLGHAARDSAIAAERPPSGPNRPLDPQVAPGSIQHASTAA